MDYTAEVINITKIKEGLYIGDQIAASSIEVIIQFKLTHMINATGEQGKNQWETIGIKYLTVNWSENPNQTLFDSRDEIANQITSFIEDSLSKGEGLLIHSIKGQNRVCVVVLIYLMKKYKWGLNKCIDFLKSKKKDIDIPQYFIHQLVKFEYRLIQKGEGIINIPWSESNIADPEEELLRNTYVNGLPKNKEMVTKEMYTPKAKRHIGWADTNPYKKEILVHLNVSKDLVYQKEIKVITSHKRLRPSRSCMKGKSKSIGNMNMVKEESNSDRNDLNINPAFAGQSNIKTIIPSKGEVNNSNKIHQNLSNSTVLNNYLGLPGYISNPVNYVENISINKKSTTPIEQKPIMVNTINNKGIQISNSVNSNANFPSDKGIISDLLYSNNNNNNNQVNGLDEKRVKNQNSKEVRIPIYDGIKCAEQGIKRNEPNEDFKIKGPQEIRNNHFIKSNSPNQRPTSFNKNDNNNSMNTFKTSYNISTINSLNPNNIKNYQSMKENMINQQNANKLDDDDDNNIIFTNKYEHIVNNNINNFFINSDSFNNRNNLSANAKNIIDEKQINKNINKIGPIPNIQFTQQPMISSVNVNINSSYNQGNNTISNYKFGNNTFNGIPNQNLPQYIPKTKENQIPKNNNYIRGVSGNSSNTISFSPKENKTKHNENPSKMQKYKNYISPSTNNRPNREQYNNNHTSNQNKNQFVGNRTSSFNTYNHLPSSSSVSKALNNYNPNIVKKSNLLNMQRSHNLNGPVKVKNEIYVKKPGTPDIISRFKPNINDNNNRPYSSYGSSNNTSKLSKTQRKSNDSINKRPSTAPHKDKTNKTINNQGNTMGTNFIGPHRRLPSPKLHSNSTFTRTDRINPMKYRVPSPMVKSSTITKRGSSNKMF